MMTAESRRAKFEAHERYRLAEDESGAAGCLACVFDSEPEHTCPGFGTATFPRYRRDF